MVLCSAEAEELPVNFQLRRALKPLLYFKKIEKKSISNPYLFRSALMETTFNHSAGSHMKGVWRLLEKASQVNIRLAEMEPLSLKKALSFCSAQALVYVHPSFYRALKLKYPLDVEGVSRDGRVTTELGTSSLRHAISILAPEDYLSHSQQ